MEDNMIRIVRVGNEFWIGTFGGSPLSVSGNKLTSPRVMGTQNIPPTSAGNKWACLEMIGKPTEIEIPNNYILMNVTDNDIITAYRESVTGLTLAKTMPPSSNVVMMPRRKQ